MREEFPPMTDGRIPMGDVFNSCNWVIRDGCVQPSKYVLRVGNVQTSLRAPKTATKRVFLITDEDDPHSGASKPKLITTARTTLIVR